MATRGVQREFVHDKVPSIEKSMHYPGRNADGTFAKGNSGNPGGQLHAAKRAFFINALRDAFYGIGGVERLTEWADRNPRYFYGLMKSLIPIEWVIQRDDISNEITIRHSLNIKDLGTGTPLSSKEGTTIVMPAPSDLSEEEIIKMLKKLDRKQLRRLAADAYDDTVTKTEADAIARANKKKKKKPSV
jgi:hypothetical protein